MKKQTQKRLLNKLGKAIEKLTETEYCIIDGDYGRTALAIEGLHEWTCISMGSSVYAGYTGRFSDPLEPQLQTIIEEIESHGCYLEADNSWSLSICD